MPIGSNWWRHIQCYCRLCRHGCPCKFGESGLNSGRFFYSLAGQTRFTHHFCPVVNCILQPTGSNQRRHIRQICGVGPVIVPDIHVKFGDPRINLSREIEIPPEAIWGGIFYGFFRCTLRPKVVGDIISSANVGQVGMDVPVNLDDLDGQFWCF